jgi:hypothetical protein
MDMAHRSGIVRVFGRSTYQEWDREKKKQDLGLRIDA